MIEIKNIHCKSKSLFIMFKFIYLYKTFYTVNVTQRSVQKNIQIH